MQSIIFKEYLSETQSILFFTLNESLIIEDMNNFAIETFGNKECESFKEILVDFNNNFSIDNLINKDEKISVNLTNKDGMPQTFYFKFYKETKHKQYYLIGEADIDENLHLQNELLSLNDELNNVTRQLYKKNAELEKANNLKRHFIGTAAHDLRNPIGNIINFGELLQQQIKNEISEKQNNFLSIMIKMAKSSIEILNDILELTEIESTSLTLKLEQRDVLIYLVDIVEVFKYQARKKNIEITFLKPDFPIITNVNTGAFQQVMNNYLSNAIKYSHQNTFITVGVEKKEGFYKFYVRDEGQGIAEKELDKLFKPFSKTNTLPTAGEKSTGLGLAIVKKIAEAHNGTVEVQSNIGKGSIFYFNLPVL